MISLPTERTEKTASRSEYSIWWLNPGIVFTLMIMPFAVASYLIPNEQYLLYWRSHKYFDDADLAFVFACCVAFLCGGLFSRRRPGRAVETSWGKFSPREIKLLHRLFILGMGMTIGAYTIWTLIGIHNGLSFQSLIDGLMGKGGAVYGTKALMTTLPGVTTATQFEMAVYIIGTILCFNGKARKVAVWLVFLFPLVVLRSVIHSEREALIEIVVPCVCLVVFYCRKGLARYLRGVTGIIWPASAVSFLYLLFTGLEYGRSWTTFYQEQGDVDSIWQFSLMRLIGYYVTALNNGAYIYQTFGVRDIPYATFESLWKFPVLGSWASAQFAPGTGEIGDYFSTENDDINAEFNNMSGVYSYAVDWTQAGAVIFYFLAGILCYKCYRGFLAGSSAGLLVYPFLYIGILEVARYPYWTTTRSFPSWTLLLIAAYGMSRVRNKQLRLERNARMLAVAFNKAPVPDGTLPPEDLPLEQAPASPNSGRDDTP